MYTFSDDKWLMTDRVMDRPLGIAWELRVLVSGVDAT